MLFQGRDELSFDKHNNSGIIYIYIIVVKTKLQTIKILTWAGTALSK